MTAANALLLALPLVVALALCASLALASVHAGVDRRLTRIALGLFGEYVERGRDDHPDRQAALRGGQFPTTYREYGAKTLLFAATAAVAGGLLGCSVARLPGLVDAASIPSADPYAVALATALAVGALAGVATFRLRWWYPSHVAGGRARAIDAALPGTVAFVYALSRGGMEFPKVIRIVADNRDTYGAAADEFAVAVRNADTFGMDVVSAVQRMGRRSPSDDFREFSANLVSALRSGHDLSTFLERQYREYREEARSQQESAIDLLGTLAEAYVTVLVAGPLFLITVLVVIGFSIGDTLDPLRAIVYLVLPLGNLVFVVYLHSVTDSIDPARATGSAPERPTPAAVETAPVRRTDGGYEATPPNVVRLRLYRRFRAVRRRIGDPRRTLAERPELLLAITVPVAVGAVCWHLPAAFRTGTFELATIDDVVVPAGLFVLGTFAVAYEAHRRRIDAIEAAVPDLLERLASVNEAGMPIVTAIEHVRGSDLGALDDELDRIWADVQWGSDLETALSRFDARVRTRATARVVTLLTEAMNASGDLATVLRIAARQAAADRRLERERRRAMLEYTVVIYVSFLVFLFIVAILSAYLLPNLPPGTVEVEGTEVGGLGGPGDVDGARYETLFYHATLVQGLLSGVIAGQLSTGDARAGVKHAAVMVGVAYLLFGVVL